MRPGNDFGRAGLRLSAPNPKRGTATSSVCPTSPVCSRAGAEPLFFGVGAFGDSRSTSRMQPWRAGSPDALSRALRPPAVTRGYLSSGH